MSCAQHDEFKFDARCTCTVTVTISRELATSIARCSPDHDELVSACRAALENK